MGELKMEVLLAVDNIVLSREKDQEDFKVLLVTRKYDPYVGFLALPGGFVEDDEDLEDASMRELKEETGLEAVPFLRIGDYSKPGRDPRGRVISFPLAVPFLRIGDYSKPGRDPRGRVISFPFVYAVKDCPEVVGADDAAKAEWITFDQQIADKLAFDHKEILAEVASTLICSYEIFADLVAILDGAEIVLPDKGER